MEIIELGAGESDGERAALVCEAGWKGFANDNWECIMQLRAINVTGHGVNSNQ